MFHILGIVSETPKHRLACTHQWYYDFTVGVGLEMVGLLELLAQHPMVVNFAIDRKGEGAIIIDQRLGSAVLFRQLNVIVDTFLHSPTPTILSRSWARTAIV